MNTKRRDMMKLATVGVLSPLISHANENIFQDSGCNFTSKNKLLVLYASEFGSTQGVAEAIGKTLCTKNIGVDVKYISHVTNIEGYQQVIIGSPIQYDTWLDEAKDFVNEHEDMLSKIPVSYFFTCLTLSKKSKKATIQAQGYADELKKLNQYVIPQSIGQFAGVLDYSKFS